MNEHAKIIIEEAKSAIKVNQRPKAVLLLKKVLAEYKTDNIACNYAWFYLAYAEEAVEKRFNSCQNALKAYPDNENLKDKYDQLKLEVITEAKNALSKNRKEEAGHLFEAILESETDSEEIWLLFLETRETKKDRILCLEKILALNPENTTARDLLKKLQKNRTITFWLHPFQTEQNVCYVFEKYVEELLDIAEEIKPELKSQIKSLNYAIDKKQKNWQEGMWGNVFLVPTITAAAVISETLLKKEAYQDAFWVANYFGEMAKIPAERRRERYKETLDRLVLTACCAVGAEKSKELYRSQSNDEREEIKILKKHIERIVISRAMGSFYHKKKNKFCFRKAGAESASARQILNDSLAWTFDRNLNYFLDYDSPKVNGYVMRNLTSVFRLKLSERWKKKKKEWVELLSKKGYQDLVWDLKHVGALINPDDVGNINKELMEEIKDAAREDKYRKVYILLKDCANDLKKFLDSEAQTKLTFRNPPNPKLEDKYLARKFEKVPVFAHSGRPDDLDKAFEITKIVWAENINNPDLYNWMGYLEAISNSLPAAEKTAGELPGKPG